jgi:hypothetical protein
MATTDTDRQDGENLEPNGANEDWTPEAEDSGTGDDDLDREDDLELNVFAEDDQPEQLDLVDEDASLPWLEGDDDFEEEAGGGSFLMLAVLALGALALIIGGIWWFTRERGDSEMVADGSLIEAPDAPYKEKPEDPGGKTFEGTGDTSYAVSEGEMRQVQLGDGNETPKPGFEAVNAPAAAPAPAAKAPAAPSKAATPAASAPASSASASTGPGVQVGAYSSRSAAEAGWTRLTGAHSSLSGMKYRVVEGKADIGTVYRLQALPGDAAAARSLCAKLKAAGQDCAVKN